MPRLHTMPMLAPLVVILTAAHVAALAATRVPEVAAHRDRLTLADEPAGAVDVLAARAQLAKQPAKAGSPPTRDVVVVGKIGAMPNPWPDAHPDYPWYAGQASLFLVDLDTARQFVPHIKKHGTNTSNCAFCRRLAEKNAHAIAVVNFVDDAGQIIPIDARELLNLREGQTITVRGRAELLGGTMLVIQAESVYVRPQ